MIERGGHSTIDRGGNVQSYSCFTHGCAVKTVTRGAQSSLPA